MHNNVLTVIILHIRKEELFCLDTKYIVRAFDLDQSKFYILNAFSHCFLSQNWFLFCQSWFNLQVYLLKQLRCR